MYEDSKMGNRIARKFLAVVQPCESLLKLRWCVAFAMLLPMLLLAPQTSFAVESVCAVVKIEIKQELTLERQAFDAQMTITNGLDTVPIDNVNINVTFKDENGAAVIATTDTQSTTAKFFITLDRMTNLTAINGTDSIQPKSTAEIHWLIVPAPGASNGVPSGTLYFVGASLDYNLGGEPQNVTVTPDFIYVKPMPLLTLDYFLTQDVIADDPFTPAIEPAEPFYLGVRVTNNAEATARNVKIDSAQPKIVENEQGLLINFLITGSSVDDQPSTPSLLVNLGDVPGKGAKVGRWDMETTLAGTFTEFTAEFSHADEYGGALTSLIEAVNTHFLVRNVIVDAPGRDLVRDFLALDASTLRVYESDGADTSVIDQSTSAVFTPFSTAGVDSIYTLTLPVTPGLVYVKLADPFGGANVMKQVIRSDGKNVPLANAWFSKYQNRTSKVWEYSVNFFDTDTTGTYSVRMGQPVYGPTAPSVQFIPNRTTFEGNQVGFIVEASDVNGDTIIWTASNLPTGAVFTDNTGGQGTFNWIPSPGQAGLYSITYRATDSTGLFTEKTATIKVNPANDTDGDGMDDAWEIANFGDLSRDGTGDFDGDGISDLNEFLNNSDPKLDPPVIPASLAVVPGSTDTTSTWVPSTGATSYNIYWSLSAGVTKDNGTLISNVTSPYVHAGLVVDTTYYYIVTAVGLGGESLDSVEASAKVGIKQWGTPVLHEGNDAGDATNTKIAVNGNGDAVTVRLQYNGTENHVVANIYTAVTQTWSTDVAIENNVGNASNPTVALDSNGNAIVVWQQEDASVQSIWRSRYDVATLAWSTPATLETDAINAATNPVIVNDASGRATVAWTLSGNSVYAAQYIPVSGWLASVQIENDSATTVGNKQVVMDAFGNAIVSWVNTTNGTTYNIMANRYVTGTGWDANSTAVRPNITNDTTTPINTSLTGDAIGNAIIAWAETDGVRNNIWASHFATATGWSSTLTPIETNDVGGAYVPVVSMDSAGNAVAVWNHSDGAVRSVWASQYTTAGGWVPTTAAIETDNTASTSNAIVALGQDGSALVVWQQSDGVYENIWSTTYNPLTVLWRTAKIIDSENLGDAINVDLGRNFNGDAFAYWQQHNGTRFNAWINTYGTNNSGVPNIAPVIVTNGDQTVIEGGSVSLDATGSLDQDGSIATYLWTQLSGSAVVLNNSATVTANFLIPNVAIQEILSFNLTVTDNLGATASTIVNITVNPGNSLPIVIAGISQTVNEQTVVGLSGSATDVDSTIASLVWSQISGSLVTITDNANGTASFTSPTLIASEILTFRLTATDSNGGVSSSDVAITVSPVNTLPVVSAGVAQSVNEKILVNLNGSATDSDGTISSLVWSQLTGSVVVLTDVGNGSASFTSPTLTATEVLTFRLTVTDNETGVSSSDVSITINPVNSVPTVNPGLAQSVNEQSLVSLSGSANDTDGTITDLVWSQLSGSPVVITAGVSGSASFTSPTLTTTEILTFRLTATDNESATASADVTITVNPVNTGPTVNAGTPQIVNEQSTVTLNGTASDADGTIASLVWSQASGTTVVMTDNGSGVASFTAPSLAATEVLVFSLTATDNEGAVASSNVNITVNKTVDITPPTQVTGVIGTPTINTVALSWNAATDTGSGIATYRIYRAASATPLAEVTGLSYTDTTLLESTAYSYEVTAVDNAGNESIRSASITVTTLTSVLETMQLDNNDPSFRYSRGWPASTSQAGYYGSNYLIDKRIRGESFEGRGNRLLAWYFTIPSAASYKVQAYIYGDSTMSKNVPYYIPDAAGTVRVELSHQVGGWQWVTIGTYNFNPGTMYVALRIGGDGYVVGDALRLVPQLPDTTAPTMPTNLIASATAFEALLTWNASTDAESGVAKYLVYRNENGVRSSIGSTAGLIFSDASVFENTIYSYEVSAVDVSGNESILSAPVSVTIPLNADVTAPTQVTGVLGTATQNSITLSWQASTDLDSGVSRYRIYRDGSATPLAEVTGLGYTDTGLTISTMYSYEITAVDGAGNESSRSVAITVSTL